MKAEVAQSAAAAGRFLPAHRMGFKPAVIRILGHFIWLIATCVYDEPPFTDYCALYDLRCRIDYRRIAVKPPRP